MSGKVHDVLTDNGAVVIARLGDVRGDRSATRQSTQLIKIWRPSTLCFIRQRTAQRRLHCPATTLLLLDAAGRDWAGEVSDSSQPGTFVSAIAVCLHVITLIAAGRYSIVNSIQSF
jgi:hypothetical protein